MDFLIYFYAVRLLIKLVKYPTLPKLNVLYYLIKTINRGLI